MDPQTLADAFEKAGLSTVENRLFRALNILQSQLRRKELEIEKTGGREAREAALKPITDALIILNNEKVAIIDEINALVPPA